MYDPIPYIDRDTGKYKYFVHVADGPARLATSSEIELDSKGKSTPNLHRRIKIPGDPVEHEDVWDTEIRRDYLLQVTGSHSYLTTKIITHSDDSDDYPEDYPEELREIP